MVRCVVRSILHGGPIELFLVPASAPRASLEMKYLTYGFSKCLLPKSCTVDAEWKAALGWIFIWSIS